MQVSKISNAIVDYLYNFKAYDLKEICYHYGLNCNDELDPMHSKKSYINSGLISLGDKQLQQIAINIIKGGDCPEFVKAVDEHMEQLPFEVSMVTRRNVIDFLSQKPLIEGRLHLVDFLNRICDLKQLPAVYTGLNAEEDIYRHMVANDDLTYGQMFHLLQFIYMSDTIFRKLVEQMVNPNVRQNKEEQFEYVKELNLLLNEDGVGLLQTKTISGKAVFTLEKITHGINGVIKNIIFAPLTKKPDIVMEDTLSNEIKVINNENDDCLIYNYPLSANGLSWHDLVVWWNSGIEEYTLKEEQCLFERLETSLDSAPEKIFMREYYNYIHRLGNSKPALIPQVYCHYDPKSAKLRGGQVYVHQRMDFLMLLPRGVRVIVEIDGKQHYANGEKANPKLYADMVRDDRKLKLYGYDVYRFGGYEFMEPSEASVMIKQFVEDLFDKYDIR